MFIHLKDEDKYVHISYDSDSIKERLDKGVYDIEKQGPYFFFKENKAFQKGRVAEAGIFKQVREYMNDYFSDAGKLVRKEMGLQTRMGLFFKGEPGTGKTFMAAKLALELVDKEDGIVIYTTKLGYDMTNIVDAIRQKDPNRLIVFIWDEFEKDYDEISQSQQRDLLAFLDGGRSRDNVIVIATANSLYGIPSTLLDRPGRFEYVLEFKIQDDDILANLISALVPDSFKEKIDETDLINYVKQFKEKITVDKLKSVVRDCLVNFVKTGKLFKEDSLSNINRDLLIKESNEVNKNSKKIKKDRAYDRWRKAMGMDEDDD